MKTSNFQNRFRISVPIEWQSKKTIDQTVFIVFSGKVGGKRIGSYGSLENGRQIFEF